MRLLIVGSDQVHAIENFFIKYTRELNGPVSMFPATSIFHNYYYKNIFNKIKYRAGLSSVFAEINKTFKEHVEEFKPECIWIFKGMEIFPDTLKWAKSKGISLVNYNPDNPFIFTGRGSGNKNITDSLHLYDLHFTYSLEIEKQLKQKCPGVRIALLPFAYDISSATYEIASHQPEVLKACFLGNPDQQRASFIHRLAEKGVSIDLYGNDWNKYINHNAVTIFPPVYELELWKTLARYRVQLNIMRVHNVNSHNMRSFEVPAIGGIMLAPDTPEHHIFFEADKEIFLYDDATQCATKINYLLTRSSEDASYIRQLARKRSIESGYSYRDRSKQVIKEIESLNG